MHGLHLRLLSSQSILNLLISKRLVLGTQFSLSMCKLAAIGNLTLAKVLEVSAELGLVAHIHSRVSRIHIRIAG